MKQFRITKENILQDSPDDCYLSPDDPVHELKIAQYMGGLGSQARLAEYRAKQRETVFSDDRARIMKEMNIKPGTPAWFELWYGGKNNG